MNSVSLVNGHHDASVGERPLKRNISPNGWVVQKFGGTSVGKLPAKIAEDIVRESLKYNKVVVVCSARSTGKKVEGTTSRLLEVFSALDSLRTTKDTESLHYEALVKDYDRWVSLICQDHLAAADLHIKDPAIRESLKTDITNECKEISEYRIAAERWHLEIDSRSKDRIVSFGEKLSCRFVAALLRDRGVASEYVDLSDLVHFKTPNGIDAAFYRQVAEELREKVLACEDRVPVVTGFFGAVPNGLVDGEIGRGYTDLCAALVAVGLQAEELQVWKEVDGIFTADPTKVPTAKLLATITPAEAAELTFYGSEVIHYLTMDQVIRADPPIQIRIKNVKNPRGNGTIIVPDVKLSTQPLTRGRSFSSLSRKTPKRPTAVTSKDKISVINVHSDKRLRSPNFLHQVFSILARYGISVDLISTSEVHVSLAIHAANYSKETLESVKTELDECGEVSIIHKMAIVSVVGGDMKNMIGIAGRVFSTLGDHNINIEMISQGASEINISTVVDERDANRAQNVLHTNLFTFLE